MQPVPGLVKQETVLELGRAQPAGYALFFNHHKIMGLSKMIGSGKAA
jgi:hypothetical protein